MDTFIGNNCVAPFLYRIAKKQFNHPFNWCVIQVKDLYFMNQNYKNIDYSNIDIKLENYTGNDEKYDYVCCIVDKKIPVRYIHFRYNKDIEYIKKTGSVYSRDIIERFKEIYYRRLKRMDLNKPFKILLNKCCTNIWIDNFRDQLEYLKELSSLPYCFYSGILKESDLEYKIIDKYYQNKNNVYFFKEIIHKTGYALRYDIAYQFYHKYYKI